jgi:hypothetical protein
VSRIRPPVSASLPNDVALLVIDGTRLIINDELEQLTIFPSVSYNFHLGEVALRGLKFSRRGPLSEVSETDVP